MDGFQVKTTRNPLSIFNLSWELLAKELNEDNKNSKKRVYKLAKSMRKPQETRNVFKDKTGNLTSNPDKIAETWTHHFQTLLNVDHPILNHDNDVEYDPESTDNDTDQEITMEELEMAFKRMKNAKAPGPEKIPVELLDQPNIKNLLLKIINRAWTLGKIPTEWGKSIICPIYKKGDRNNCSNYRGISLMPHACKIYERILEKRARAKIEPKLQEWQHAYRKGRSTSDLIFAIRQLTEKSWEYNQDLYIAFIDLTKAFDSVPRQNLWNVLSTKYDIKGRLLEAIKSTYDPCTCTVMTGYPHNKWFDVKSGVKQGSVLSPILFIAYLDTVLQEVNKEQTDIFQTFGYADDICQWERSIEAIKLALERYDNEFTNAGLKMNKASGKTEVLIFGRNPPKAEITVNGDTIGRVEQAKYLGSVTTRESGNKAEITERISNFSRQAAALQPVLRDRLVSNEVKKTIFNTILKPVLLYGCESWVLTKKDISRLQAAEMKVVRTMLGKTRADRLRNTYLRETLGITS